MWFPSFDVIFFIIIVSFAIYYIIKDMREHGYKRHGFLGRIWRRFVHKSSHEPPETRTPAKQSRRVNQHEEECRRIFQNIFRKQFPSVHPEWLKHKHNGRILELDGFNPG